MRMRKGLSGIPVLVSLLAIVSAAPGQWLHVRVIELGENGDAVKVNIPLALVETVLPLVEPEELNGGRIKLDSKELTVPELRQIWSTLRSSGDFELASIQDDEMDMRITIEGDYLLVRSTEASKNQISVTIPSRVVDALLSGEGDELDIVAAVQELARSGEGEIVTVKDGESLVKVWIDSSNTSLE